MHSLLERRVRDAIAEVRAEAKTRRDLTPADAAAAALEFSANHIESAIDTVLMETERLTPEQYAEKHGVSRQTVTRWIRLGWIQAERVGSGYLIQRDTPTPARELRARRKAS